jgi:hypothetical protein
VNIFYVNRKKNLQLIIYIENNLCLV